MHKLNPKLRELDVSNNTKLTGMEVTSNGLTTLTLGQQPDLEFIYLNDNELTSLDLISAPYFTQSDFAETPLRSINLSAAPDLNALYIFGTELEELDLTGNPILLDAYLNGTRTVHEDLGYVEYAGGPLGGRLLIDEDQLVVTEETPDHIPGDIDGNGRVNVADVALLAKYIKAHGQGVNVVAAALDVNGDGRVNVADVTLLAKYIKAHGQGVVIY